MAILGSLTKYLWPILGITGIAMLMLVLYIVRLVKSARKKAAAAAKALPKDSSDAPSADEKKADKDVRDPLLRSSFLRGFERLKSQSRNRDFRYKAPWYVLLGQAGSRPVDMLANAGMSLSLGKPEEQDFASELGCRWWFFDRAVVIELAGEYVLRSDGESSDERGLRSFMRLLQRFRPRRPIDGVVLTISARELLDAARAGALGVSEIEQKATMIYQALWQLQRTLGIKFPVYVQITECDGVRGFGQFADVLPDKMRQGMFGWSNPYSIDTTYRPEWVNEVFDNLTRNLERTQLEIYAEVEDIEKPDELFVFPSELQRLKEPLRVYLNQIFKPIAYHESMLLRGIYITGSESPEAPDLPERSDDLAPLPVEMPDSPSLEPPRANLFLKDLFEKKIFPESNLAMPTGASLAQKNRRVRFAQAGLALLTVILFLGLLIGNRNLRERERELQRFLADTQEKLARFEGTENWQGGSERERLREGATEFLDDLAKLDASRFFSLGVARSWIPDFNDRLESAFVQAYDVIVFQAIRQELENRAALAVSGHLFDTDTRSRRAAPGAGELNLPPLIEDMPEFKELLQYVEELNEIEEHGRLYNNLKRTQSLEDLGTVVEYLFSKRPPDEFFRKTALYEAALDQVDYVQLDPTRFRPGAIRRTRELYDNFYRALFVENPFLLTVDRLNVELTNLPRQRWTEFDEAKSLRRVVDLIAHVDRSLSEPSLYWAFRDRFDLGPEFSRLRALMDSSSFLKSGLTTSMGDEFYQRGEERWRMLRRDLLEYDGAGVTGPIFKQNQTGALMQLSGDVEVLRTSLEGFLGESFMVTEEVRAFRAGDSIPDFQRYRLRWDTNLLSYAIGVYEPYQRFVETGLRNFPPNVQSTLKIVAQQRLDTTLSDLIYRSRVIESLPEDLTTTFRDRAIREEVIRFEEAEPLISRLLAILQEAQLGETRKAFAGLVAAHTYEMLRIVDSILVSDNLYRPRNGDFDWWDVEKTLAFEAFGAADPDELQAYVERQRKRISELANELAQPLVAMLTKTAGERERDLALKWDAILDQLGAYNDKQPGNSIELLNQLITKDLTAVGLENCFDTAREATPTARASDFFRERELGLRDALYRRCFDKVGKKAADAYFEVQEFFTQRLAGRFPFASGISDIYPTVAEPEALRTFFISIYDKNEGLILGVPTDTPSFGDQGPAIHAFVKQLGKVRAFLAPFLENPEPGALPVLDFEVEFRVNRQAEVGGDQVIEWRLEVGEREVVHPPPDPVVRWTWGDGMRLTLRWAEGSEWQPDKDQEAGALEISGKTVTYTYDNPWSLVSFLQDNPSVRSDFQRLDDEKPETLKFTLDMERAGEDVDLRTLTVDELTSASKLFIRLSLITPDSKEPIRLPRFPSEAPRLPRRDG